MRVVISLLFLAAIAYAQDGEAQTSLSREDVASVISEQVGSKVSELQSKVNEVAESVTSSKGTLEQISQQASQTASLQKSVEETASSISSVASKASDQADRLAALEKQLAADFKNLLSEVEAQRNQHDELSTRVQGSLDKLQQSITSLSTRTEEISSSSSTDDSVVSELKGKLSEQTARLDALESQSDRIRTTVEKVLAAVSESQRQIVEEQKRIFELSQRSAFDVKSVHKLKDTVLTFASKAVAELKTLPARSKRTFRALNKNLRPILEELMDRAAAHQQNIKKLLKKQANLEEKTAALVARGIMAVAALLVSFVLVSLLQFILKLVLSILCSVFCCCRSRRKATHDASAPTSEQVEAHGKQ